MRGMLRLEGRRLRGFEGHSSRATAPQKCVMRGRGDEGKLQSRHTQSSPQISSPQLSRYIRTALLFAMVMGLCVSAESASAQTIAITGGTVHTVSGAVIDNGVVVMRDGRIEAVGTSDDVSIPSGATRIDATGKIVTPGLFDAGTQTGLVEVGSVGDTRDASYSGGDAFRPAFRVTDGIQPNSVVIPVTRTGGVTTVASIATGGAMSGQGALLDLTGGSLGNMLIEDGAAMYASFNPSGASSAGGARGALALRFREALEDARVYPTNRRNYQSGSIREFALSRLDLEALQPVLSGDMPLVVRASRAADIDAALRIAEEFDLRLVIMNGEEAWRVADRLAAAEVPVILKPLTDLPVQFDRLGSRFDNAALLTAAGVHVVISTLDTHNARNLRYEAGNAVRFGMDRSAALRSVTLEPAIVMGVADDYGSIETGKVANLVIWSGDPFDFGTAVEHVLIRGREVDLDNRQHRLFERYRTLDDRPVQYH